MDGNLSSMRGVLGPHLSDAQLKQAWNASGGRLEEAIALLLDAQTSKASRQAPQSVPAMAQPSRARLPQQQPLVIAPAPVAPSNIPKSRELLSVRPASVPAPSLVISDGRVYSATSSGPHVPVPTSRALRPAAAQPSSPENSFSSVALASDAAWPLRLPVSQVQVMCTAKGHIKGLYTTSLTAWHERPTVALDKPISAAASSAAKGSKSSSSTGKRSAAAASAASRMGDDGSAQLYALDAGRTTSVRVGLSAPGGAPPVNLGSMPPEWSRPLAPLLDRGLVSITGQVAAGPSESGAVHIGATLTMLVAVELRRGTLPLLHTGAARGSDGGEAQQSTGAASTHLTLAESLALAAAHQRTSSKASPSAGPGGGFSPHDVGMLRAALFELVFLCVHGHAPPRPGLQTASAAMAASGTAASATGAQRAKSSGALPPATVAGAPPAGSAQAGEGDAGDSDAVDNVEETVAAEAVSGLYSGIAAEGEPQRCHLPLAPQPAALRNISLRPYQRQGLAWMVARERGEELRAEEPKPDAGEGDDTSAGASSSSSSSSSAAAAATIDLPHMWERHRIDAGSGATSTRGHIFLNPFTRALALSRPPAVSSGCAGGILADEMGLGKTAQTVSLILAQAEARASGSGAPRVEAASPLPYCPATLVVAPMSLISQWQAEIAKYTVTAAAGPAGGNGPWPSSSSSSSSRPSTPFGSSGLRVLLHYGCDRARDAASLSQYDVVITTYGTLASEYDALAAAADAAAAAAVSPAESPRTGTSGGSGGSAFFSAFQKVPASSAPSAGSGGGPAALRVGGAGSVGFSPVLLGVCWERIALDEAHTIRNRTTRVARACCEVAAVHRWALTGTPIQNSLQDLYSLLRFLRHEPWAALLWWKRVIADPFAAGDPRAMHTLQAVLRPLLLRRTKAMTDVDGRAIGDLPPPIVSVVTLSLSPEERTFYDSVYSRARARFAGFAAAGRILSNYAAVLTLLLRLRQAADHPYLVIGSTTVTRTNAAALQPGKGAAGAAASSQQAPGSSDPDGEDDPEGTSLQASDLTADAGGGGLSEASLRQLYRQFVADREAAAAAVDNGVDDDEQAITSSGGVLPPTVFRLSRSAFRGGAGTGVASEPLPYSTKLAALLEDLLQLKAHNERAWRLQRRARTERVAREAQERVASAAAAPAAATAASASGQMASLSEALLTSSSTVASDDSPELAGSQGSSSVVIVDDDTESEEECGDVGARASAAQAPVISTGASAAAAGTSEVSNQICAAKDAQAPTVGLDGGGDRDVGELDYDSDDTEDEDDGGEAVAGDDAHDGDEPSSSSSASYTEDEDSDDEDFRVGTGQRARAGRKRGRGRAKGGPVTKRSKGSSAAAKCAASPVTRRISAVNHGAALAPILRAQSGSFAPIPSGGGDRGEDADVIELLDEDGDGVHDGIGCDKPGRTSAAATAAASSAAWPEPDASCLPLEVPVAGMSLDPRLAYKVVVFSSFTFMLDLVQRALGEHRLRCARLDGAMSQAAREAAIRSFASEPTVTVFLISLKAGGLGLNLQDCASIVYLLDPWYNPAAEAQALARVHRLGQVRPVYVRRLIAGGTVEEEMLAVQARKQRLADGALEAGGPGGPGQAAKLTEDDLIGFFRHASGSASAGAAAAAGAGAAAGKAAAVAAHGHGSAPGAGR